LRAIGQNGPQANGPIKQAFIQTGYARCKRQMQRRNFQPFGQERLIIFEIDGAIPHGEATNGKCFCAKIQANLDFPYRRMIVHFLTPLLRVVLTARTSSIEANGLGAGAVALMMSSNPPNTICSLRNAASESTPCCSNLRKVGNGTPARSASPACVSSIAKRRWRTCSASFCWALDGVISDITV
jgi:hypothetical protein